MCGRLLGGDDRYTSEGNLNVRDVGLHVHELDQLDAFGPVLNQLLAKDFTYNDDGLRGRVVIEGSDSEDQWVNHSDRPF